MAEFPDTENVAVALLFIAWEISETSVVSSRYEEGFEERLKNFDEAYKRVYQTYSAKKTPPQS